MKVEMLIREIREAKGISLSDLSEKTGITKSHLSNIERNLKDPTISILIRIALALDVKIEELYKYKE